MRYQVRCELIGSIPASEYLLFERPDYAHANSRLFDPHFWLIVDMKQIFLENDQLLYNSHKQMQKLVLTEQKI
jgi:hypothetical protein